MAMRGGREPEPAGHLAAEGKGEGFSSERE